MRKQTFHQSISIFTMRVWLHYNDLRGDTRHSYLNDFGSDIRQVNHLSGYRSLMNLIKEYRLNRAFKNVLVYDNISNVPVYSEVFVPSANSYRIKLDCKCLFNETDKGHSFYAGYESFDPATGEIIFNPVDQDKVRAIAKAAYEFVRKRKSMPGIVYPQPSDNAMEQGRGKQPPVHFNVESLRDEKILNGFSPSQLSQVADFLLKMKGLAA